ncbi:MAG TPA: hypothetical protein VFN75_05070 [Pseudonocardiaceae bacterium]|nr:hypothetical protein [Pseudonocardiaceae bacterium]
MKNDQTKGRIEAVLAELRQLIAERYPEARFSVAAGPEDPQEVHLVATVDLEDPDEVLDVVMERMLQFQLDEGLAVYVSPRRTPQRRAAVWAAQRQRTPLLPPSGSL